MGGPGACSPCAERAAAAIRGDAARCRVQRLGSNSGIAARFPRGIALAATTDQVSKEDAHGTHR
ncbi:hypothetical protein MICRO8M_80174 [Microbacterium sp. 8M]|nr:hypothetical protein MICRO8M_80174 [Microbacterium sp. 8M]